MNISTLLSSHAFGDIPVLRLMAEESAALIILAVSLLVFRTFRERYLLVWIGGWVTYFAAQWGLHRVPVSGSGQAAAVFQGIFVLSVGLFTLSIFLYAHAKKLLLPLALITGAVIGLAVARVLLWPD